MVKNFQEKPFNEYGFLTKIQSKIFRNYSKIYFLIILKFMYFLDNFECKQTILYLLILFNIVDQDNKYLIINSRIPMIKMNYKLEDIDEYRE